MYRLSYELAMEIFHVTTTFPREERYSLTDQMRRSSRSIPANIAEGWKKRRYPKLFVNRIIDSWGEAAEIEVWLDFAKDCGYLAHEHHRYFLDKYEEVSKMLYGIVQNRDKFAG
ncbi:MAG TPA: four helix bundle protein [Bacteroidota bacterium]|nr:four helix bundle protein [Bacteroidota bacterium]